jgi:transposase-like protein
MTEEEFEKFLVAVASLSRGQLAALDAEVRDRLCTPAGAPDNYSSIQGIEERFAARPSCPHCQSDGITKWGSAHGLMRYRCKACKKTFNALTGTPLAQLHKRGLWSGHAQALVEGIPLRKVASRLNIHLETAFRWRHRFLQAPKALKPDLLEGTVEADESYFRRSQKGARQLKRPGRKRGAKTGKRGTSDELVPVLIARTRRGITLDGILSDISSDSIAAALEPVMAKNAVLVSDGAKAYRTFASTAGLAHVALNIAQGQRVKGIYHVQNVNNYSSRLKGWMRRFNGVATKYLDSYLGWYRTNDREGAELGAGRMLAAAWGWY